jgi:hypothetical protein
MEWGPPCTFLVISSTFDSSVSCTTLRARANTEADVVGCCGRERRRALCGSLHNLIFPSKNVVDQRERRVAIMIEGEALKEVHLIIGN